MADAFHLMCALIYDVLGALRLPHYFGHTAAHDMHVLFYNIPATQSTQNFQSSTQRLISMAIALQKKLSFQKNNYNACKFSKN
jgi:hypothetical protein